MYGSATASSISRLFVSPSTLEIRPARLGRLPASVVFAIWLCSRLVSAQTPSLPTDTSASGLPLTGRVRDVTRQLQKYCYECHHGDAPQGNFVLPSTGSEIDAGRDIENWRMIFNRVKFRKMPPASARQPDDVERNRLLDSLREILLETQQPGGFIERELQDTKYGNYIDHVALFSRGESSAEHGGDVVMPAPPRIWRLRPQIYAHLHAGSDRTPHSHVVGAPLSLRNQKGFKDYSAHYFIDEPTAEMLLLNSARIVKARSRDVLQSLTHQADDAEGDAVAHAIRSTFLQLLQRKPSAAESARFAEFHRRIADRFGFQVAAEKLLTAIYMQPQAVFREELGDGPPDVHGRRRLSQHETALAVSFAFGNSPDDRLLEAAAAGKLSTRPELLAHIRRRFDQPPKPNGNPRLMQFFREYFDYPHATEIFKSPPKSGSHRPDLLVSDLDLLITHIVEKDDEVLFHLLTTDKYFVDCRRDDQTAAFIQAGTDIAGNMKDKDSEYASVYGLPRDWFWTDQQPIRMPGHMRAGVLTHPAWLVAWSGNLENHPVQRGKWIRTHLLGGTVPDVPIGVDAMVPNVRGRQFRERLSAATKEAECSRCHEMMDPVGLPFEQYDHYGRFRIRELGRPVDTTGLIAYVDDVELAGRVADPIDMVNRLARSQFVEQVFVRHVFRFFMGRNETLGDAKTIRDAHHAYRKNNGSYRALVTALLLSDSFLMRRHE